MAEQKPLEVKEGILLDREGAEIPQANAPRSGAHPFGASRDAGDRGRTREVPLNEFIFNRTQGSAMKVFQLGPVAKFFLALAIPVFLVLGLAFLLIFVVGAVAIVTIRSIFRILGLAR